MSSGNLTKRKGVMVRFEELTAAQREQLRGKDGTVGKDGRTPVKGVDYFTPEDIAEVNNTPRTLIEFDNGVKLVSRESGIYVAHPDNPGEEMILYDSANGRIISNDADYAICAEMDIDDNPIIDTYATKDELEDRVSALETEITESGDSEMVSLGIMNGTVDYYGVVSQSIEASVVGNVGADFSAALYFATPSEMPSNYSQFPADVCFKGDSTDNGAFVPEANMRYTIVFDFDGYMLNGYVSGVTIV